MTKDTMRMYYLMIRSLPLPTHALAEMKRTLRKAQAGQRDPLRYSLRDHFFSELGVVLPPSAVWRVLYSDWDSWKMYSIFRDDGLTDAEIEELLEDQRVEIHSAYDCTGKPFTHYIHWKRTPAGIAVVHAMGLDV